MPAKAPAVLPELDRAFGLVVFDWDGTAVADRRAEAGALRERLRALMERGVTVVIVSGTHLGNIAGQLALEGTSMPRGRLYATLNRGSEVYAFDASGRPERIHLRQASADEDTRLDRIAERLRFALGERTGLPIAVVSDRLNRRKVDLIPLPEWQDPPKARIAELLAAVTTRFEQAGEPAGLQRAIELARRFADEEGLPDARLTTDVKHVEIGLTDKADSMAWIAGTLAPSLGIPPEGILVAGDEFGPLAGFEGSDSRMRIPAAERATFVSVGPEPNGVPPGVLHLGGGPERFLRLLEDQAERALPAPPSSFIPTLDASWCLVEEGWSPALEHEVESRFALSNGYSGSRGSLMEGSDRSRPGTFLAGVFDPGRAGFPELVIAPVWSALGLEVESEAIRLEAGETLLHRRMLDMRRGMLLRVWRHRTPEGRITRIHELRWASLSDRHVVAQWLWLRPENYAGALTLSARLDGRLLDLEGEAHLEPLQAGSGLLVMRTRHSGVVLAVAEHMDPPGAARSEAACTERRVRSELRMERAFELRRACALYTSRDMPDPAQGAAQHARRLSGVDFERLAREQARAWQDRWDDADVRIAGDDAAQRALRFAVYHLIGSADPADPGVSIGARALTGEGYKGHVFWDTEIFMLPFYVHTHPPAARSLLSYRHRTLEAARQRARRLGYRGALYAWESADTGEDVTPASAIGLDGTEIPILTGALAHHVSADVAFSVWQYVTATGDEGFLLEAGAEIMLEVARFWASRVTADAAGGYHLRHVIGPDEYHADVDDNAYTNEMARWCLEKGQEVLDRLKARPEAWRAIAERIGYREHEEREWGAIARGLHPGLDPARGIHEQFAGYFRREDLDLSAHAGRTVPMDVLLGRDRISESQVVKQADVVMLLHLLWDRFPESVRSGDFRYYAPRTGHGSSLSPGAHALVAARLHDVEAAMRYFRFAAGIDLGNRMGNSSEGVHAAALGCLWQVVIFGFAGLHSHGDGLELDPVLPAPWSSLEFPFHYRGQRLRFTIAPRGLSVEVPQSVRITLGRSAPRVLPAGRHHARQEQGAWKWMDTPSS